MSEKMFKSEVDTATPEITQKMVEDAYVHTPKITIDELQGFASGEIFGKEMQEFLKKELLRTWVEHGLDDSDELDRLQRFANGEISEQAMKELIARELTRMQTEQGHDNSGEIDELQRLINGELSQQEKIELRKKARTKRWLRQGLDTARKQFASEDPKDIEEASRTAHETLNLIKGYDDDGVDKEVFADFIAKHGEELKVMYNYPLILSAKNALEKFRKTGMDVNTHNMQMFLEMAGITPEDIGMTEEEKEKLKKLTSAKNTSGKL